MAKESPNKLRKLEKLLDVFETGSVQQEEMVEAIDAVVSLIKQSQDLVVKQIKDTDTATQQTIKDLAGEVDNILAELSKKSQELSDIKATKDEVLELRKEVADGLSRIESLIPELPPEFDATDIYQSIQDHKGLLENLSQLVLGENIRNALEVLPDGEKLSQDAIEGLPDELKKLKESRERVTALMVRRLDQIIDVDVQGATNGQVLAYNATSGLWEASSVSGSGDMTKAVYDTDDDGVVEQADAITGQGDLATLDTITESLITDLGNYQIKAVANGSLTAALDTYYVCVANSTFTDPTPTEGEGFAVFVRNGTATVGGTGYSTAGTIVHRIFHSGAWTNYVYQVSSTFATAAQGTLADSAVQPGDNVSDLTNDAGYLSSYTETDPVVGAVNGLVKANGAGTISAAVAGTDYLTPGTAASTYQPLDSELTAISGLTSAADRGIYFTGAGTASLFTLTSAARSILDDTSTANIRTTLGVGTGQTPTFTGALLSGQTASTIASFDASKNVVSLSTATYPSLTELSYIKGVTSAVQTQLNTKAATASPTFTGVLTYTQSTATPVSLGNLGATETIDFSAGHEQYGTLDSNVTITHSNEVSGRTVTLYLAYDGSAQRTITWSDVDKWLDGNNGSAPTTPSATGHVLVVTLKFIGTTCYASATGNYAVY